MRQKSRQRGRKQRGFTLMEVLVATVVLLVGLIAVIQVVPVAITANNGNRRDSTALVIAQRALSQMLSQPITTTTCTAPACPDAGAGVWNIGDTSAPGFAGSPVLTVNNRPSINFSSGKVANYNFTSTADPEDPYATTFDVRWAVITTAASKRFIISARQVNSRNYTPPYTLDVMVQK